MATEEAMLHGDDHSDGLLHHNTTQHNTTQHSRTQHNTTQNGIVLIVSIYEEKQQFSFTRQLKHFLSIRLFFLFFLSSIRSRAGTGRGGEKMAAAPSSVSL